MRKRLPAAERRALIEDAAARLFAEHGYAGTRLDQIASAAEVTKPVLYRHFASKKALYLALLQRHEDQLRSVVDPIVIEGGFANRLPALVDTYFTFVESRPHTWKMIFRDTTGGPEIAAARAHVQDQARGVLMAILRAQPDLRIPEPTVEPAAEIVRSAMSGVALWWLDHPDVSRPTLVQLMTGMIDGLLRTSPS